MYYISVENYNGRSPMKDTKEVFETIGIWGKTRKMIVALAKKKKWTIAQTVHDIVLVAYKRNFSDVYDEAD